MSCHFPQIFWAVPTKTKSEHIWMSIFCPNWIGARNVTKLNNFFKIWSLLVYRAVLKLKHGFIITDYSDFIADNRHTWRWYARKQQISERDEKEVLNSWPITNKCPKIWRLTNRFPNRSELFFWTPKISGPDWHHYIVFTLAVPIYKTVTL